MDKPMENFKTIEQIISEWIQPILDKKIEDGARCPKRATLLPHFFQKGTCKLYRITEEDLK